MPTVLDNIEGEVYRRFIEEAINRSTSFMLVNRTDFAYFQHELYPAAYENPAYMEGAKRLRQDHNNNFRIYQENCEPFVKKLEPFLRYTRHDPIWPNCETIMTPDERSIDICMYRACKEVIPYLLEPGTIFSWIYPYFPDDLSFFKDDICWFHTVSHEELAFLHTDSEKEVGFWESIGIEFSDKFDYDWDVNGRFNEAEHYPKQK